MDAGFKSEDFRKGARGVNELKFFVITDTHYFKNSLGAHGEAYDSFMRYEQKCFAETEVINKAVLSYLAESDLADIVLIAGDLSFNGEKESHLAFVEELKKLKQSGKRVYVITAGHDFNDHPFSFDETGRHEPEGTKREELFDLYYDFGFSEAIAVDREHLSYVVQLSDSVRLLALNNDGDCEENITYDDRQIAWIKEQTKKAREDGQMMIAMNHYPLLPGQPIFSIIPTAVQQNAEAITTMLADEGVHLVFTGHMHNQSINEKITEKGNKFYDVCTGSTIADPAFMRLVTVLDRKTVKIESIPTPDFDWDTGGRDCKQYLDDLFDSMILNIIEDMRKNPEVLLQKFGAADKKSLYPVFKTLGKILNKMTVGGVARLLCIHCDKSIRKMLFKNYVVELVRGVLEGNQTFVEGTPKGDVLLAAIRRLRFVFKKLRIKTLEGDPADMAEILKHSAGNYGIDDYNATLILE